MGSYSSDELQQTTICRHSYGVPDMLYSLSSYPGRTRSKSVGQLMTFNMDRLDIQPSGFFFEMPLHTPYHP